MKEELLESMAFEHVVLEAFNENGAPSTVSELKKKIKEISHRFFGTEKYAQFDGRLECHLQDLYEGPIECVKHLGNGLWTITAEGVSAKKYEYNRFIKPHVI